MTMNDNTHNPNLNTLASTPTHPNTKPPQYTNL